MQVESERVKCASIWEIESRLKLSNNNHNPEFIDQISPSIYISLRRVSSPAPSDLLLSQSLGKRWLQKNLFQNNHSPFLSPNQFCLYVSLILTIICPISDSRLTWICLGRFWKVKFWDGLVVPTPQLAIGSLSKATSIPSMLLLSALNSCGTLFGNQTHYILSGSWLDHYSTFQHKIQP